VNGNLMFKFTNTFCSDILSSDLKTSRKREMARGAGLGSVRANAPDSKISLKYCQNNKARN
jgi:hypothetical protein